MKEKIVAVALFLTFNLSLWATCVVPREWSLNPVVVERGTEPYTFSVKSHHDGKSLGVIRYDQDPEVTFPSDFMWFDNKRKVIAGGLLFVREDWGFGTISIYDCSWSMFSYPRAKRKNNGGVERIALRYFKRRWKWA